MVIVPKKDGSARSCVDCRKLNPSTIRDAYPIPRMDDCIDSLGDAKVFTAFDTSSAIGRFQSRSRIATRPRSCRTWGRTTSSAYFSGLPTRRSPFKER